MKRIGTANVISGARIPLSLSLLLLPPEGTAFHTVYALCGLSDIADGYIARKSGTESEYGSRLDSIADAVFVLVCLIRLFPFMHFKSYVWLWAALIAALRLYSLILGYIRSGRLSVPHTAANKLTGLMLFVFGFLLPDVNMNIAVIPLCVLASFAAVQELILRTKHT